MSWRIELTPQATRDLHRLDRPISRRVVAKLERIAVDPLRFFQRLVGYDLYKLRVGDYRILAAISREHQKVLVQRIDHRSRIYGR